MDAWRDSEEPARGGLGRGGRLVMYYLITGAVLATLRIALIAWGNHHQAEFANWGGDWVLYPEALLLMHTRLGDLGWYDSSFVFAVLLAVGSFVMTMPILLVGWLSRRRR